MIHRFALSALLIALLLPCQDAVGQDFDKGRAAARAGDFATAIAEWLPLAEAGDPEAQFNLGAVYESGLGVAADPNKAMGWYAQAAGQGHPRAQYNLGVMYAEGRGVERNDVRAATWMREAARQDHAKAQYNLGVLYQTGRGLPKDQNLARFWFMRAAANGIAPGRANAEKPEADIASGTVDDAEKDEAQPSEQSPAVNSETEKAEAERIEPARTDTDEPKSQKSIVQSIASIFHLNRSTRSEPGETDQVPELDTETKPDFESAVDPDLVARPPTPLRVAANFSDGETFRLEVTETRERLRDGGLVMAQTTSLSIDMAVTVDAAGDALIEWTYGPAEIQTAGDPNAGRLANAIGKLIEGQKIAYLTNQAGEVIGLQNPNQLAAFYRSSIDRVVAGMRAQAADTQLANSIRDKLQPLLTPASQSARALELPRLLHFFNGLELETGKVYRRSGEMNLPPGAESLASALRYELKWFDQAAGVAWLRWTQEPEPGQAARAVQAYLAEMLAQSGQDTPEDIDIGAVEVADSADYEIDLKTGFPKQVVYTRKVDLFGFSQTEKRRVRVLQ